MEAETASLADVIAKRPVGAGVGVGEGLGVGVGVGLGVGCGVGAGGVGVGVGVAAGVGVGVADGEGGVAAGDGLGAGDGAVVGTGAAVGTGLITGRADGGRWRATVGGGAASASAGGIASDCESEASSDWSAKASATTVVLRGLVWRPASSRRSAARSGTWTQARPSTGCSATMATAPNSTTIPGPTRKNPASARRPLAWAPIASRC